MNGVEYKLDNALLRVEVDAEGNILGFQTRDKIVFSWILEAYSGDNQNTATNVYIVEFDIEGQGTTLVYPVDGTPIVKALAVYANNASQPIA
ncbi:hypothetical protein AB4865_04490 [Capnocytophaga sp. ARDL2]|uniref:hypothetical protein n=1 Tax=Capnocytophaga sp. ARDL2 TaxID=3238809 RepID=UPI003558C301